MNLAKLNSPNQTSLFPGSIDETSANTLPISLIGSDRCAIVYEDRNFDGSSLEVKETGEFNLPPEWDDEVSSVKVTEGCILRLYRDTSRDNLLYTLSFPG